MSIAKAVCALIYNPDDKNLVLGVSRKYDSNMFGLPGGKLDIGETGIDALRREVKEETGLDITNPQYIFERSWRC